MLIPLIGLVVAIGVIISIVQIRNTVQRISARLDDIYQLLKQQNGQ